MKNAMTDIESLSNRPLAYNSLAGSFKIAAAFSLLGGALAWSSLFVLFSRQELQAASPLATVPSVVVQATLANTQSTAQERPTHAPPPPPAPLRSTSPQSAPSTEALGGTHRDSSAQSPPPDKMSMHFKFRSHHLSPEAQEVLNSILITMKEDPQLRLSVRGTFAKGEPRKLAWKRAEGAAGYLHALGVEWSRIQLEDSNKASASVLIRFQ